LQTLKETTALPLENLGETAEEATARRKPRRNK
jgi:hypothetical protein